MFPERMRGRRLMQVYGSSGITGTPHDRSSAAGAPLAFSTLKFSFLFTGLCMMTTADGKKLRPKIALNLSQGDFAGFKKILKSVPINFLYFSPLLWFTGIINAYNSEDHRFRQTCRTQGRHQAQGSSLLRTQTVLGKTPTTRSPQQVGKNSSTNRNLVHEAAANGAETVIPDVFEAVRHTSAGQRRQGDTYDISDAVGN
ncbi:hypothetical protein BP5796_07041 [Coleophoma crateriformis]|uniref:Uncharacterized protein n=1 Tax=Coleophoma crateriformis TaxID=565419 RepID=A0A3D8RHR9_9HELO|nr:hypothetical protein BP5796_07041 [Coleophoma crateriformis]